MIKNQTYYFRMAELSSRDQDFDGLRRAFFAILSIRRKEAPAVAESIAEVESVDPESLPVIQ